MRLRGEPVCQEGSVNSLDLLGMTATAYLSRRIGADDVGEGTARFLLDRLPAAHIASICRRILLSADLSSKIRLRIPRALGSGHGLPEEILTDERTTHWRHSTCDRPVLLIANTDDDQGQSLRDITPIGSQELLGEVEIWVAQASEGLGLSDANVRVWPKALKGLQDARPVSLENFARFVLATRLAIKDHGLPLLHALGWALPELRVPRDSAFFTAIPEKSRGQAHQWKRLFLQAFNKRAPFVLKQTPTQQVITNDQLREMWERVRDEIPAQHHPVVQAFIDAPGNWNEHAEALARLEWEQDNIKTLFDGLRVRRVPLGSQTLEFFEDDYPDTLTEDEQDHLTRLDERKTREANDEDEQFYERHRLELGRNRTLKSRWDRFSFGQPIEANDFAVGLLKCLERLFEQSGSGTGERVLRIEVQKRSKRDWLDMNYDAVCYFSRRYRGIRNLLTGKWFNWEVGDLFTFERLVEREQARQRFQRTQSMAKATNQIRFDVSMACDQDGAGETYATQLIWIFEPGSICAEFVEDLARVRERPCSLSSVTRESVSRKGQLQAIELKDVSTLMPVFRQDRGSLVPSYKSERNVAVIIPRELDVALSRRRITTEGHAALKGAWQAFLDSYRRALQECFDEGVSSVLCLELESTYGSLLEAIQRQAPGDANRKGIWEPILGIGLVPVDGGTPAAIIAPWHPLRLLGMAVRARQVCGLIRHLMRTASVDFGDARVFFEDLAEEFEHPYYPEVCLGMDGSQPILLNRSDTYADYTLMEPATANTAVDDSTNENPADTAWELHGVVEEYLKLQPHERANLSRFRNYGQEGVRGMMD